MILLKLDCSRLEKQAEQLSRDWCHQRMEGKSAGFLCPGTDLRVEMKTEFSGRESRADTAENS